jgi:protein arginine N-methyltransferase 1
LAAANGLADRIEFIQADSRRVDLPERVDVIISDIRGALPFYNHAISCLEDARQRFLSVGGLLIPQRDILKVALIEAPDYYSRLRSPWETAAPGLDLSPALQLVLNSMYGSRFAPGQLLTCGDTWCELNYSQGAAPRGAGKLALQAAREGVAHGLCLWFEAQLLGEIGYSAGPENANSIYGQVFCPWPYPVPVAQGQEFQIKLQTDPVGSDYVWRWDTKTTTADGNLIHFQQSTFEGANFSPQALRCRAANFVPSLSETGQADRWLLQAVDGKTPLQEMAQAAAQRFPGMFPRWEDALQRAAELARQFSR